MHDELLYLDYPPMRFLWERLAPTSVLDLGCGSGGYVEILRRWVEEDPDSNLKLPMHQEVRSLNLASTATAVMYEAVRQFGGLA